MQFSLFSRPDPDAELVASASRGDVRAFDALVYRYQGRLTQFVRARLDCAIDADDVAQEALVAAWRELPRFRGRSSFKTWLFGIALNHCAEAARRHVRLRKALGEWDETLERYPAPPGAPGTAEWSALVADHAEVRERIAALVEVERQVLELYYYGELNLREISELLNINLSTLKYRFYQAHRRLRETWESSQPASPAAKTQKGARR